MPMRSHTNGRESDAAAEESNNLRDEKKGAESLKKISDNRSYSYSGSAGKKSGAKPRKFFFSNFLKIFFFEKKFFAYMIIWEKIFF